MGKFSSTVRDAYGNLPAAAQVIIERSSRPGEYKIALTGTRVGEVNAETMNAFMRNVALPLGSTSVILRDDGLGDVEMAVLDASGNAALVSVDTVMGAEAPALPGPPKPPEGNWLTRKRAGLPTYGWGLIGVGAATVLGVLAKLLFFRKE